MKIYPAIHYTMGGTWVDYNLMTTVPGLYSIGESNFSDHGANRLGGNSLAETVAIGKLVGEHVAERVDDTAPAVTDGQRALAQREFRALGELEASDGSVTARELLADLGDILWEHAGILRDEDTIRDGLSKLDALRARTAALRIDGDRTSRDFEFAVDLSFSLPIAETILRGALERSESRGAHFRTDYPEVDDSWRRNILFSEEPTGLELRTRGVAEPSPEVQDAVDTGYELDYHHLE